MTANVPEVVWPSAEEGPTTVPLVKRHLGITDARDDDRLAGIVAAVNVKVRRWPVGVLAVDLADWSTAADAVEGATLLAARLFRRKNSPAGVETFGNEGAAYVVRMDPDVALLLRLGNHAGPVVG